MKTLIAILCFLSLASCVLNSAPKKELSISPESIWLIQASAGGYFTRQGDRIMVVFNKITLSKLERDGAFNGDAFIEGVQVGLATERADGWVVERWGGMLHVNQTIGVGQLLSFDDYSTSIAVGGIEDLSKYWFVLKVDTEILDGQHGMTYSHSLRGLIEEK